MNSHPPFLPPPNSPVTEAQHPQFQMMCPANLHLADRAFHQSQQKPHHPIHHPGILPQRLHGQLLHPGHNVQLSRPLSTIVYSTKAAADIKRPIHDPPHLPLPTALLTQRAAGKPITCAPAWARGLTPPFTPLNSHPRRPTLNTRPLPPNLLFVSASPAPTISGASLTWEVGDLPSFSAAGTIEVP